MKFGKDFVRGIETYLTSWKSDNDPSPGPYMYMMDTNGYPQIFQMKGSVIRVRIGPWNGVRFDGLPAEDPNRLCLPEFIINQNEIYLKYEYNTTDVLRALLRSDGDTMYLQWVERGQDWITYGHAAVDACSSYGLCGAYGSCDINKYPLCSCIEGFVPTDKEEWNAADWSSGCQHKEPIDCGNGDGFKKVSGLKFPDTRSSRYNKSMTLEECEMACRRNCSCTAYANLDIRNGGTGCLMWFGGLMDIRENDEKQHLYIRMAFSESQGT